MINIKIDYLTNSIRNVVSGDTFETKVSLVSINDKKFIKKSSWIFNWHNEIKRTDRKIFKLTIKGNHKVLQGLISLSIQSDHIYVHLIESAKFNKFLTG